MSRSRTLLCALYYAIAAIALVATWRQNLAFMAESNAGLVRGFMAFWPALLVNRPTISITVDIFLFVLAAVIWMLLEARRLQVRWVWLYVLFAILVAISVTFPLFLAARERRLAALHIRDSEPDLGLADKLGLGAMTAGTIAFAIYCTLL